ncbi:MAG TPA: type II toxin-antitoxin system prevent-host-death family antitoxin [Stellaceae bacterium]|nr:type II toxin-antitoxin system prevent-host-death family antitoxin [Stellaceae bacterium]
MAEKMVSISTAKADFSKLVAEAEAGDEIVLTWRGKPVAKLVVIADRPKRVAGSLRGQVSIGPEFFEALPPEELDAWDQ